MASDDRLELVDGRTGLDRMRIVADRLEEQLDPIPLVGLDGEKARARLRVSASRSWRP